MKIFFARHGETDWNVARRIQGSSDIELNANGKEQAHILAESLKSQEITKIYTSTQKRAMETGHIVSTELTCPMYTVDGIQEMNLGKWEGHTWEEVETMFPDEFQVWFKKRRYTNTPDGESYQEVLVRLFHALDKIVEENTQDILIITHGAVIQTLLALMKDVPFENMNEAFKVSNASAICFEKEEVLKAKEKL